MDQKVSEDVFFCLNGETLVVRVRKVVELYVEVGPDGASDLSSELEDRESSIFVFRLAVLKLVHKELVLLGDDSL